MDLRSQHSVPAMPLRVASILLASWIFVLSLAGVSPALHSWLHADSGCAHACEAHGDNAPSSPSSPSSPADTEGHFCGVIALQGTIATVAAIDLPTRTSFQHSDLESPAQQVAEQQIEQPFQARAPPLKS
jgi:hypothetical protein